MATVKEVYNAIDSFAPFKRAEDWDNVGLLLGDPAAEVSGVLLSLDMTNDTLEEAFALGCNLIVTHHPVIFKPLKALTADSLIYRATRRGISVICAHTNLDVAGYGVNFALADILGLSVTSPLDVLAEEPYNKIAVFVPPQAAEAVYEAMTAAGAGTLGNYAGCAYTSLGEGRFLPLEGANPAIGTVGKPERTEELRLEMIAPEEATPAVVAAMLAAHPYETPAYDVLENKALARRVGLGLVGNLPERMSPDQLAYWVQKRLGAKGLRYFAAKTPVERVAVCGGSGGSLLSKAVAKGAQALITGDVKHDVFLEAKRQGITLIDAGHFATENVVLPLLSRQLLLARPELSVRIARTSVDILSYL